MPSSVRYSENYSGPIKNIDFKNSRMQLEFGLGCYQAVPRDWEAGRYPGGPNKKERQKYGLDGQTMSPKGWVWSPFQDKAGAGQGKVRSCRWAVTYCNQLAISCYMGLLGPASVCLGFKKT